MNPIAILSGIGLPDILDILLISVVSYYLYLWFWGTKAFKALVGIGLMSGIFVLARFWGLFLTTWMFQILWQVFVILMIIIFQKEIRQVLESFNPLQAFGVGQKTDTDEWVKEFVSWAFEAAKKRTGAIIVFQKKDLVSEIATPGISFRADPSAAILETIFQKHSPLHDGAIVIGNRQITRASCYLPLSTREDLPLKYGTRHRAALGLTEQCDASTLVISEERGQVSFARNGEMNPVPDADTLEIMVRDTLGPNREKKKGIKLRLKSTFFSRFKAKISVFAMVFAAWLVFAGQQNIVKTMDIPVRLENVPSELTVSEQAIHNITVTCRGLRKDISLLDDSLVYAVVDLSFATPGIALKPVTRNDLILPNDRIDVTDITPATITLLLAPKQPESGS